MDAGLASRSDLGRSGLTATAVAAPEAALTIRRIQASEIGYENCNGSRGGAIAHGQDGLTIRR